MDPYREKIIRVPREDFLRLLFPASKIGKIDISLEKMGKDKYSGLQEFRVSRVSTPRRVSDPNHADLEIRFRPISNKKY